MAGKIPSYRLVIGKSNVGVLWEAVSKSGKKYFSGNIDVTALRQAIREKGTKSAQVSVDRTGKKEVHDVIRVAMFDAQQNNSRGEL